MKEITISQHDMATKTIVELAEMLNEAGIDLSKTVEVTDNYDMTRTYRQVEKDHRRVSSIMSMPPQELPERATLHINETIKRITRGC